MRFLHEEWSVNRIAAKLLERGFTTKSAFKHTSLYLSYMKLLDQEYRRAIRYGSRDLNSQAAVQLLGFGAGEGQGEEEEGGRGEGGGREGSENMLWKAYRLHCWVALIPVQEYTNQTYLAELAKFWQSFGCAQEVEYYAVLWERVAGKAFPFKP